MPAISLECESSDAYVVVQGLAIANSSDGGAAGAILRPEHPR